MIFLVDGTGAAATVVSRGASGPGAMLAGCLVLLAGAVVTLGAIETSSAGAFLAGTAVAGAGFGTAMLGTFRTVSALAVPGQRAAWSPSTSSCLTWRSASPWWRPGGHHRLRPAPDGSGLRRGHRRSRRCGGGQPDLPQALPRPSRSI